MARKAPLSGLLIEVAGYYTYPESTTRGGDLRAEARPAPLRGWLIAVAGYPPYPQSTPS